MLLRSAAARTSKSASVCPTIPLALVIVRAARNVAVASAALDYSAVSTSPHRASALMASAL